MTFCYKEKMHKNLNTYNCKMTKYKKFLKNCYKTRPATLQD